MSCCCALDEGHCRGQGAGWVKGIVGEGGREGGGRGDVNW